MEYENIKNIINDMENSKLESLDIEFSDGTKISMKKNQNNNINSNSNDASINANNIPEVKIVENKKEENQNIENKDCQKEEGNIVKSPMVGTFYASATPNHPAFVKVGQKVKKGEILCIIEAMKLMNEIESEYDGEVVEILVQNEEMVDYNKPLFRIK